jgi:hypothetical protein
MVVCLIICHSIFHTLPQLVLNVLLAASSLFNKKHRKTDGIPGKLSNVASASYSTSMPGSLCFLPCDKVHGRDGGLVRHLPSGKSMSSGNTKAVVVVAVGRIVPVAVGGSHVPGVVDPGAAAKHTAGAPLLTTTQSLCIQE